MFGGRPTHQLLAAQKGQGYESASSVEGGPRRKEKVTSYSSAEVRRQRRKKRARWLEIDTVKRRMIYRTGEKKETLRRENLLKVIRGLGEEGCRAVGEKRV